MPVVQARRNNKAHYVKYMLFAFGPEVSNSITPPCFVQSKRGHPTTRLRPHACTKNISHGSAVNPGAEPVPPADEPCDTALCPVHLWARARFSAKLPNPSKESTKCGEDDAVLNFWVVRSGLKTVTAMSLMGMVLETEKT